MMQSLFCKDMMKKILCQGYLWLLLLLLYAPIFIIMIYSFTEAKVLGNWTGFSTKLYSSLFTTGTHHSLTNALINTLTIAVIAATVSTLLGSITAIGISNLQHPPEDGPQLYRGSRRPGRIAGQHGRISFQC